MERLQVVGFTAQEIIISCLYTKAAWDYLQSPVMSNQRTRTAMRLLIVVQLLVLIIDLIVTVLDCAGYFAIKGLLHSFVYSIKLELEFVILNHLVAISRQGLPRLTSVPFHSESALPNSSARAPALPAAFGDMEKSGGVKSSNERAS
jgi:hypothetical protein